MLLENFDSSSYPIYGTKKLFKTNVGLGVEIILNPESKVILRRFEFPPGVSKIRVRSKQPVKISVHKDSKIAEEEAYLVFQLELPLVSKVTNSDKVVVTKILAYIPYSELNSFLSGGIHNLFGTTYFVETHVLETYVANENAISNNEILKNSPVRYSNPRYLLKASTQIDVGIVEAAHFGGKKEMKLWSKEPVSVFVKDGGKLVEKKALVQFEVLFHRAGEKFFATVVNKIENIHEIAPLFNPTISMSGARVEIGDTFKQHLSIIIQPDSKITLVSTHLANYDESGPVWGQERAHVLIFENGYTLDRYALVRFEASKRKGDDGDIVTVKRILGLQDEQVNDNHVVIGSVHDDLNFNSLINNFVKKIGELKRTKYNTLYFGESDGVASTLLLNKVDFVTVYSTVNMKSISIKRSVLDKLEKVQDFRKEAYFPLLALFWPEP